MNQNIKEIQPLHPARALFNITLYCFTGVILFTASAQWFMKPLFGISLLESTEILRDISQNWVIQANRFIMFLQHIFVFLLPPLFFMWLYKKRSEKSLLKTKPISLNQTRNIIVLLIGSFSILAITLYINSLIEIPKEMLASEQQLEELIRAIIGTGSVYTFLVNVIIIAILPAVAEEFLFRGVIQKYLIDWTKSKWTGIIITAAIFSLLHFQLTGFIPRLALGVLLGWLYVSSGNIWIPIAYHFGNNLLSLCIERFMYKTAAYNALEPELLTYKSLVWIIPCLGIFVWGIYQQNKISKKMA